MIRSSPHISFARTPSQPLDAKMVKVALHIPIYTIDYNCKDRSGALGSKADDRFSAFYSQPLDPFRKARPLTVGLRGERTDILNGIPTLHFDSL